MRKSLSLLILICMSVVAITAIAQDTGSITATDASKYVGQKKMVCGKVVSTKFLSSNSKQPTFLNLDKPYPNQVFTIVIWGSDRKNFSKPPETEYADKELCVTGVITSYKDKPEIVASAPTQIQIVTYQK